MWISDLELLFGHHTCGVSGVIGIERDGQNYIKGTQRHEFVAML